MEIILDTNAISAMAENDTAILPVLLANPNTAIPVVALGEYRYGLLGSRRRKELEKWLQRLLEVIPVLPITEETTYVYAEIFHELRIKGRPIPVNDVWIAALARQHTLPILSRNAHFNEVNNVQRVGW